MSVQSVSDKIWKLAANFQENLVEYKSLSLQWSKFREYMLQLFLSFILTTICFGMPVSNPHVDDSKINKVIPNYLDTKDSKIAFHERSPTKLEEAHVGPPSRLLQQQCAILWLLHLKD